MTGARATLTSQNAYILTSETKKVSNFIALTYAWKIGKGNLAHFTTIQDTNYIFHTPTPPNITAYIPNNAIENALHYAKRGLFLVPPRNALVECLVKIAHYYTLEV